MTDQPAKKPLTVRDLQAILAECDPDATVDLTLPGFIDESDKAIVNDPDVFDFAYSYTPKVSAGYVTSKETPYEQFFDANGHVREGVKPNHVSIELSEVDTESLGTSRKRAIEAAAEDAGMDPEPALGDAETVIVDVAMPRSLHAAIRTLLHSVNTSPQVREERACTHGPLTVTGALAMLAEDLGMVETRPGCWEASNMAQVLASHGYKYPR